MKKFAKIALSLGVFLGVLTLGSPAQARPLKKLVVYHSHWGSTRLIANAIASEVGADLQEVKTKNDIPTSRFWAMFWGGKMVTFNEKPEILPLSVNPQDYDVIYIGTPVWSGSPSAPMSTFIANSALKGKQIALFCTFDGRAGNTFTKMKEGLADNAILGELGFKKPGATPEVSTAEAKKWAREILDHKVATLTDDFPVAP